MLWWPDEETIGKVTDLRIRTPDLVLSLANKRKRREQPAPDGRLNVLAADHPARGVVSVGDDPDRMTDRHDYLRRIVRVLSARNVDGVMASMDVLEELLLLDYLGQKAGRASFLDHRLLIVSVNRGGICGTRWELRDPMTGATASTVRAFALDGAKVLWRFDPQNPDSLDTMMWCAETIGAMNELSVPTFLEPLPTRVSKGKVQVVREPIPLARLVGIANALGNSSRHLWLKLPYCNDFEAVCRATTLPILLLGGPASGRPEGFVSELADAIDAGTNVRGVMLGRNVLYPANLDPLHVAEIVGGVVHDGWTRAHALSELENLTSAAVPHSSLPRDGVS